MAAVSLFWNANKDLTKLRRRKKSNRFNEQNNNSARVSRFFVPFFAVSASFCTTAT